MTTPLPTLATLIVKSEDGTRDYPMLLTPGGWQHADAGCAWWQRRSTAFDDKPCRHVKEAIKMAESDETILERSVVVAPGVEVLPPGELYRMIDEFDADLIAANVEPDVVEAWCYSYRSGREVVTGISIRGVEAAIREQMKHGEIIRLAKPEVEYEDEDEIRLTCTAMRYVINPNTGQEILADSQTRALRQTKYQLVNVKEPTGESWPSGDPKMRNVLDDNGRPLKAREDDPKWYEKAYSKAARNAAMPFLRQDVKSTILANYRSTEKYTALAAGRTYTPRLRIAAPEDQRNAPPTRRQQEQQRQAPQQQRQQRADTPAQRADAAPTTANAPETPPAPSQPATQGITKDTQNAIARVMTEVGDTQGDNYITVYKDLMATFPEAVIDGRLRGIKNMSEDRAIEMLSRLRVWQSGEDPNAMHAGPGEHVEIDAALPPEPEEGVWEEQQ